MGSFTTGTSRKLLPAIFPGDSAILNGGNLAATATNIRIYNTTTPVAAGNVGIFTSDTNAATRLRHGIHLIASSTATAGGTTGTLTDSNFSASGFVNGSAALAGLRLPPTSGTSQYLGYAMHVCAATTAGTGVSSWRGWALDGTAATVRNDGQITFPTNSAAAADVTVPSVIVGFLITADVGNTSTNGGNATAGWINGGTAGTTWSSDAVTGTAVIAYGDLSTYRDIKASDTPVFTGSAIQITLD